MHRIRSTFLPIAVALPCVLVACGGEKKKAAAPSTEVSTTTTTEGAMQGQMMQLQRERDEARASLEQERSMREREAQSHQMQATQERDRDELEMRVVEALEKADQDMQSMRDKAAKGGAKARQNTEKTMKEAEQQKAKLYSQLRRIHGDVGENWDSFKSEVESSINELSQTLSKPDEGTGTTKGTTQQPAPKKAKPAPKPTDSTTPPDKTNP